MPCAALWVVLAVGLVITAICLLFMLLASLRGGWGANTVGLSVQSFLPWNWLQDLGVVAPLMAYFLPAFLAFIIAPNLPNARIAGPWLLAGFAAFALWVVPQLILYSAAVFQGRFLYPFLVGPAALNGWGIAVVMRRRMWLLTALAVMPTALVFGQQSIALYNQVGRNTAQAQAFDAMLVSAAEAAADRAIVIAADPALVPEWICAIPSLLGAKGIQNPLYLEPVNESGDPVAANFSGYLTSCLGGDVFLSTDSLTEADVGAVLLLASRSGFEDVAPGWYQAADWQAVDHAATFETFRFNRAAPPATVTFTSLERSAP